MNINDLVPTGNCYGCTACVEACPLNAIELKYKLGFLSPVINKDRCVECGKCISVCQCLNKTSGIDISEAVLAVSNNYEIYRQSASGGVFGEMAHHFISTMNGVVCGAAMLQGFIVKHIFVETEDEIVSLQNSKYVQSNTDGIYLKAKQYLEEGRNLLFSGTPCQIVGLKIFLNKDYSNLYCVDIVCHGVPSPELFKEYISRKNKNKKCKTIIFRTKDKYDRYGFNLKIEYSNGKQRLISSLIDPYYRLFLNNMIHRESCYSCPYACGTRYGDITIGDCGNREKYLGFHSSKTISTVFPITEKGKIFWKEISNRFDTCIVDKDSEIKANAQLNKPAERPITRGDFYPCQASDIEFRATKCLGIVSIIDRIKAKLKRIIPQKTRRRINIILRRSSY